MSLISPSSSGNGRSEGEEGAGDIPVREAPTFIHGLEDLIELVPPHQSPSSGGYAFGAWEDPAWGPRK